MDLSSARFADIRGRLDPGPAPSAPVTPSPSVVLSVLSHGASDAPAWPGLSVCYVARGAETYRIGGRAHLVREGEFLFASQAGGGEVEIRRGPRAGTLGLCMFLPGAAPLGDDVAIPESPFVLSAQCSGLGALLGQQLTQLLNGPTRPRASTMLRAMLPHAADLATQIARHVEAVPGARRTTRHEAVRRVHAARAHLHATTTRAVGLDELAQVTGLSAFQLVRTFRDCFGDPPALYHRKLRLQLVREHIERTGATWQQACERFGFAGGSSFSHAWRRTFGTSPSSTVDARRA